MKTYNLIEEEYEEYDGKDIEEEDVEEEEDASNDSQQDDDEWQVFSDLKVDDSYAIGNVYGVKNTYENFSRESLTNELYKIYEDSPYFNEYEVKKPRKSEILEIVVYFLEAIEDSDKYSMCEKIVGISDLMRMDYTSVYHEMPSKIRYKIMSELNEQYDVVKTRAKRLI